MIEIRRILCPIDFSDHSRRALDHAIALARWYDSTITALQVFPRAPAVTYAGGPPGFESFVLTRADRDQLLADLRGFVEAEAAPGVPIGAMIREGNPAREILGQAMDMNADALVMGTHGRSGFERLLLGSVTERTLRKAACPVLTVPSRHPDAVPAAPVLFKRILCPIDFSDCSVHALAYAMSLAQEADAALTVLYVLPYEPEIAPDAYETTLSDDRPDLADDRRRREDGARQRLKDLVPAAVSELCHVDTIVSHGKPGREVLRAAETQQVDLIVMGVQGRGQADLTIFGSTTNLVVREATCPVLTLRR